MQKNRNVPITSERFIPKQGLCPFYREKETKKINTNKTKHTKKKQFTLVKTGLTKSLSFDLFLITDTPNFEE